ncbi:lysozyme g-like [Hypanus sabinus]|uniref:lysozyme g-like n=1 Tax=Hypanus sabinus TaxID=79690 RepID=UPI0028C46C6F|nr:lysozyme g-like [Hypanus sabinus]
MDQNYLKICRYGDITRVDKTGASQVTAKQDGRGFSGGADSQKMMETDLQRANRCKSSIYQVVHANQIDPAPTGAIASLESRVGNVLVNGCGNHGNAFGLMLDQRHEIGMFEAFKQKFPTWNKEQHLKDALAAYNMGQMMSMTTIILLIAVSLPADLVATVRYGNNRIPTQLGVADGHPAGPGNS